MCGRKNYVALDCGTGFGPETQPTPARARVAPPCGSEDGCVQQGLQQPHG